MVHTLKEYLALLEERNLLSAPISPEMDPGGSHRSSLL